MVTTQKERKEKKRKLVKEPKRACVNILRLQKPASFQSSRWGKKRRKKITQRNTPMFLKCRREEKRMEEPK